MKTKSGHAFEIVTRDICKACASFVESEPGFFHCMDGLNPEFILDGFNTTPPQKSFECSDFKRRIPCPCCGVHLDDGAIKFILKKQLESKTNIKDLMPKNIYTPRNELVCGKLDIAESIAIELKSIELLDLLGDIRHDCERMEHGLIRRKEQVEELLNKQTVK